MRHGVCPGPQPPVPLLFHEVGTVLDRPGPSALIGLTLQPEDAYLDLLGPVIAEEADYYEVAPETLWYPGPEGTLLPNGFHPRFAALGRETGRPFVAHGVGLSLGTLSPGDEPRRQRWFDRIRQDHAIFRFLWYTDHLGASLMAGRALTLPLPVPMTAPVAAAVRERLLALQQVVPDVGFENTANYYVLGDPLAEPGFFSEILSRPRLHLLLDLHNVHTMAVNLGFDPREYLDHVDLSRVIEIHMAGGSQSDPAWLPGGETMRLDSHDSAVPEEVWSLLGHVLPRCPNLRGITLERMEGTVGPGDVSVLRDEMRRLRHATA